MAVASPESERGSRTRQFATYAVGSGTVLGLAVVARVVNPPLFERLIGGTDPIVVAAVLSLVGAVLLRLLESHGRFAIIGRQPARGLLRAAGLAALFGLLIRARFDERGPVGAAA